MKKRVPIIGLLLPIFCMLLTVVALWQFVRPRKQSIGLITTVTETSTGLEFEALVDTGAFRCSMNCQELEIEGESEIPEENMGKIARILIVNEKGEEEWLEARLADYSTIHTVDASTQRYHVRLTLRCQGVERKVSVTLRDRSHMKFPMLLGRNFLRDRFVVDVSLDNPTVR